MKKSLSDFLNKVCLLFIIARFSLVMTAGLSLFSYTIVIPVAIVFTILNFKETISALMQRRSFWYLLASGISAALQIILLPDSYKDYAISLLYQIIIIIAMYCINSYLSFKNRKSFPFVTKSYLFLIAVSILYSGYYVIKDPSIIRKTASLGGAVVGISYSIATFSFIYMITIAAIMLCFYLVNDNRVWKIGSTILLVLMIALISLSGYTIAFIILVIGCFWAIMDAKKGKWLIVLPIFIAILLIVFNSGNMEQNITTSRFNELLQSINLQNSTEITGLSGRFYYTTRTWEAFFQNPFFGQVLSDNQGRMGDHNFWIDLLAVGGLFFQFPLIAFLVAFAKEQGKRYENDRFRRQTFRISYAAFICLGLVNNMELSYCIAPFLILLPFLADNVLMQPSERIEHFETFDNQQRRTSVINARK